MADASSNPFPVLPQYQGDYLDAQRQMALAQALQQQALSPMASDQSGWNQMRVVPRASALSGLSKLGEALAARSGMSNAISAQRNVGQEQWQGMQQMFAPQGPALQQGSNTSQAPATPSQNGAQANGQPYGMMQPGQQAPQPSPNPPQSLANQGSPMNPAGIPGSAAAMMYMRDPNSYLSNMVAPYYKPTDATLMANAAGLDPRSANAAALAKSNNIAPVEGRGGGTTWMGSAGPNGQVTYSPHYNQQVIPGAMPVYDASGNVTGVTQLPGSAGVSQQMSEAQAAGKANQTLILGVVNGMPGFNTVGNVVRGVQPGQGASQTGFPGVTGLGAQPTSGQAGGFAPGLPAGSEGMIKDFVDRNDEVSNAAKNAPQDIQAFQAINQAAAQAKTGVGFDRAAAWKSMASVIPGIDPNASDKVNADIIGKYSQQIASRNGGRSDAALDAAVHSITNSSMSPEAIHELTPSLIGGRMADLGNANARQQWLQDHGNAPASLMQYEQQWNKTYDPDVYRLQAMQPNQQQQFIKSLPPQRAATLMQSRQTLKQMGAIPDLPQVQ